MRTSGVEHALEVLAHYGWHDTSHGVWLTEGAVATLDPATCSVDEAYEFELIQAQRISMNYELLSGIDAVTLWTYHTLHDLAAQRLKLGLRQDFDWERGLAGAEKLAWDRFVELPAEVAAIAGSGAGDVALPAA